MKLEESIIEQLPQIPYVVDQVGDALKWAKEVLGEGEYNHVLEVAYDVTEFTKKVSVPNFFKTHYVVATILSNINGVLQDERFSRFDSASKSVEKALKDLIIDPKEIEERGCFKTIMTHLIPLAKRDIELFTVGLIGIKNDLKAILEGIKKANVKTPVTGNDYISILGYALVIANIRMSKIEMTNEAYEVYNDITIMLNNDFNY